MASIRVCELHLQLSDERLKGKECPFCHVDIAEDIFPVGGT
jgi:hypothetical protein